MYVMRRIDPNTIHFSCKCMTDLYLYRIGEIPLVHHVVIKFKFLSSVVRLDTLIVKEVNVAEFKYQG